MTRKLDRSVREFVERMRGLKPGDVLSPLSPHDYLPPGSKVLVLEGDSETGLTLSIAMPEFILVADPKGPFRWSAKDETLLDREGQVYELVDLGTQVSEGEGLAQVAIYQELIAFNATHQRMSTDRVMAVLATEPETMLAIGALLNCHWFKNQEERFVACFSYLVGRALTEHEQAHLMAIMTHMMRYLGGPTIMVLGGLKSPSSDDEVPPGTMVN